MTGSCGGDLKCDVIHLRRMGVMNLINLILDDSICVNTKDGFDMVCCVTSQYNRSYDYECKELTRVNDIVLRYYGNTEMMKTALREELERLRNIENY